MDLTSKQIVHLEMVILEKLKFNICFPTSQWFAAGWALAMSKHNDADFISVVSLLLELALIEYECLQYSRTLLAAAAVALAWRLIECVRFPPSTLFSPRSFWGTD